MNSNNNGCFGAFSGAVWIIAIVACILMSVAGVQSMGFIGLLIGPCVILIAAWVLGGIFK
ncbi:MAG: hypothetical protein IKQ69_02180 [Oscillospiraceae bacterium]|nr:hypothetical protein [Oscillospiraceae bacterium]